jgi:hypothetical protein
MTELVYKAFKKLLCSLRLLRIRKNKKDTNQLCAFVFAQIQCIWEDKCTGLDIGEKNEPKHIARGNLKLNTDKKEQKVNSILVNYEIT